ncbi:apolipoprotein L3-like isoform X1 [Psammomys obesus]|uniref:apolipoprotein L3-like isoform X1 n=2 Tax=Psammomys obesus TaxID=48139 RepID=UPI002452ED13|nr:apolipoprotein L3-like isoform X1 [Psammomys obesus]XP_055465993.1 apolipoprotein L3-like isoform X1 [Psammomys obesus]XP_055465994.1 apolipoprotein L3-like isoform X1 [Psammomys obesus]
MASGGSRCFISEASGCPQDMAGRRDLHHLLADDGAWEAFVSETNLPRERAAALHEVLRELTALLAIADRDRDRAQKGLKGRKKFLKAFPRLKAEVEEQLTQLYTLADHAEELHRGCAISNVVADSFSTASDILGLLGLFLAPVTAEGSLMVSATGLGLGVAATVADVAKSIMEDASRRSDEAEAHHHASTSMEVLEAGTTMGRIASRVTRATRDITRDLEALEQHMDALRLVRANPRLEEEARIFTTTGNLPAQQARKVQTTMKGTPLAMSREARICNATSAGVSLLRGVDSLVNGASHLYEGARSESAEALRKLAREMEEKLEELITFSRTL